MTLKVAKSVTLLGMFLLSGIVLFAVAGCQTSRDENFHYDEIPMDRRIGSIKSLGGIKTTSQGTHILQLDDGDTIMLKSLAINLDDEKYAKKVVEVRGVLTYTTDSRPLMEVMNIDIIENYQPKADAKSKWKEFSSEELGFSIKYRDDFEKSEEEGGVTFTKEIMDESSKSATDEVTDDEVDGEQSATATEDNEIVTKPGEKNIIVVKVTTEDRGDENLIDYLGVESDSSSDLLTKGITKSKIGSNALNAFKKEADNGSVVTFYLAGKNSFYEISYDASKATEPSLTDKNLFFEMIGTLVLFDPDESSIDDSEISSAEVDENFLSNESGLLSDDTETSESDKDKADDDEEGDDVKDETDDTDDEPIAVSGYDTFESDSFDFSVLYPKGWYYSGEAGFGTGSLRHYEFGSESLENEDSDVSLDVMSGDMPSGSSLVVNGAEVTKVSSGGLVEIYIKGEGSRYYKITGASGNESILTQMASSIAVLEDKPE